ncbi:MAG: CDGSH iron-sulfur domain-containing protein [Rubricoccaceae bacterium]|nr:CDGSH iron-sulfur domain-containing protein [Rubricoccaceae bacterium]
MAKRTYSSDGINVHYDVNRCIHAAECVRGAPRVFNPKRRPWIDAEQGQAGDIAEVVLRCPTGALSFTRKDAGEEERPERLNTVTIQQDGPHYLRGNLQIESASGEILSRETRMALCRCGLSNNKPFCDNSHKASFFDGGELGSHNSNASDDADTPLRVILSENGPLLLRGPAVIVAADGSKVETAKCALCRCGRSSNKPFCDGTHKEVGFIA